MKSYTDLEQSRKLAEILPFESADQTWVRIAIAGANLDVPEELQYRHNGDMPFKFFSGIGVPCWSLAALLSVLPNNEHIETTISIGSWKIDPVEYLPNTWWCEYEDTENQTEFNISADNPVDACYEMIIKLHEQKLL